MKKAYLLALAMGIMLMAGCSSSADENGHKNRTTTPAKTPAVSEDSSEAAVTTSTADSGKEAAEEIKVEKSRITSKAFFADISYPDGWEIKAGKGDEGSLSKTVALGSNDDLGVSMSAELLSFDDEIEEGRLISDDELTEKLKQAYTDMTGDVSDADDPMSISDISFEEGSIGNAKTLLFGYTQRNVRAYLYTFIFREGKDKNRFLVFSYAYSDSENAEHIKTALEQMMSGK